MSFILRPPRSALVLNAEGSFTVYWYGFFRMIQTLFASGYTGTVVTAKLTGGGANGALVFENGVLVSETPAT